MTEPEFVRATSVDEAIAALARAPGDSIVVAGGVVVGSLFNQRLASPAILVDITRIAALRGIALGPAGELRIGALVTHEEMRRSPVVAKAAPLLAEIAVDVSCPRLRNRGTLGGSVCTIGGQGDPATGLIALGASLELRGPSGQRVLPIEDFYKDAFAVDLQDSEIVETVVVPPAAAGSVFGFCKLGPRKAMDWTQITASVAMTVTGAGTIAGIRVGMNGVGPTPNRPRKLEAFLGGRSIAADSWAAAAEVLNGEISPASDLVYSDNYKRRLGAVAVRRAIERAMARASA